MVGRRDDRGRLQVVLVMVRLKLFRDAMAVACGGRRTTASSYISAARRHQAFLLLVLLLVMVVATLVDRRARIVTLRRRVL